MKLTSEEIYEAALDDELFNELPSRLAATLEARSCVLHWRHNDGAAEISTHSGYFSDAQMADYASNFVSHDIWTQAGMRHDRLNSAWKTTDLVPSSEYEQSVFFNDWIRAMGDDTFYCCGSVMRTMHGFGIIGLHRGRSQGDFQADSLRELNSHVGHLRRMFAIRGRISTATQRRDLLTEIFSSCREPALIVTGTGRLLMANPAGDTFLRRDTFLRVRNGQVRPVGDLARGFDRAIAAASRRVDREASDLALTATDGAVVMLSVVPLLTPLPQRAVLVTVHAPRKRPPRAFAAAHLQQVYRLSTAEADIALRMADGQTIAQISNERLSAIGTVRTQVKHILSKLNVSRQAEVVRLVVACLDGEGTAAS